LAVVAARPGGDTTRLKLTAAKHIYTDTHDPDSRVLLRATSMVSERQVSRVRKLTELVTIWRIALYKG
jgi:hypothetical protein